MADLNIDIYTQVSIDEYAAIGDGDTPARVTHAFVEVLRDGDPNARITHAFAEVLRDGVPYARITHVFAEVLRANEYTFGNTFDAVSVDEDVTVEVEAAPGADVDINIFDSPSVDESVTASIEFCPSVYDEVTVDENIAFDGLSIVSVFDSILVEEDVTVNAYQGILLVDLYDSITVDENVSASIEDLTLPLGLAHNNSAPYDYFSLNPDESDPITVQINLDQTGGNKESDYVLIYLIADDSFDLVTIDIESEDAGVEWKISETDSDYGDQISKSSVTAGAYPVYAKAIVANDGSITEDQVSANLKVAGW